MKAMTQRVLEDISAVEWFSAVGEPFGDLPQAIIVKNWKEAVESCSSTEWVNIQMAKREYFFMDLRLTSPSRANEWNSLVEEITPVSEALVNQKTEKVIAAHHLPKAFVDNVRWDMLNSLMEAEYWDMHPPGFYLSYMINVYHKGHFPCGWIGEPLLAHTRLPFRQERRLYIKV